MKHIRFPISLGLCVAALLLNNYWVLAPFLGLRSDTLVSTLALAGAPDAMLFRVLSVVAGDLLLGAGVVTLSRSRRQWFIPFCIMLLGLCIAIDGIFTINCEACTLQSLNASGWVHAIESTIYVIGVIAATIVTAVWRWRSGRIVTALLQLSMLVVYLGMHSLVLLSIDGDGGLFQRVTLGIESLLVFWVWYYAATMLRQPSQKQLAADLQAHA